MNTISCNCGSLNFIPWKNDSILFNFFPLKTNSYGNKLDNSIPIEIHKTEFHSYLDANGGDMIVEVNLIWEVSNCKIREVQIVGVKEGFLHINFLLV